MQRTAAVCMYDAVETVLQSDVFGGSDRPRIDATPDGSKSVWKRRHSRVSRLFELYGINPQVERGCI